MSENPVSENSWSREVEKGSRFRFGDNWRIFLRELSEEKIEMAKDSLCRMLNVENLNGKTFLDAGCGSGLFSLAAFRLGAKVVSFDFDPQSVECAIELHKSCADSSSKWIILQGSVLDKEFLSKLESEHGLFDVVYSWGVLHHTGRLYEAIDLCSSLTAPGGLFYISIYNDQGPMSRFWLKVKKAYCSLPNGFKWMILWPTFIGMWFPATVWDLLTMKGFSRWRSYTERSGRGMSPWRDVVDWVGGYPFEVAKPEEIFYFLKKKGFILEELVTKRGQHGCCEYVLRRRN